MVWPTISGIMVERRDQVRSTFFSLREFMPSTRDCRKPSTNGPFLVERAIKFCSQLSAVSSQPTATNLSVAEILRSARDDAAGLRPQQTASFLAAPVDDKCVRALVIPRLVSASRLPPRGYRMTSARSLAFSAAVRVIDRVHRNAAIMRPLA